MARDYRQQGRGNAVVRALCYKPEGSGFETRWGEYILLISLIRLAELGLGFIQPLPEMSTRERNGEMFLGSSARPVREDATLSPYLSQLSRQCVIATSDHPISLQGLL
jgi:hypothetical protein